MGMGIKELSIKDCLARLRLATAIWGTFFIALKDTYAKNMVAVGDLPGGIGEWFVGGRSGRRAPRQGTYYARPVHEG